jgi:hypothetical protein
MNLFTNKIIYKNKKYLLFFAYHRSDDVLRGCLMLTGGPALDDKKMQGQVLLPIEIVVDVVLSKFD